ncbi:AAA family ATPase [Paenibacillus sp. CF384]|uniref:AAA family ATPase n=1 Tax=Paenibacillus sp. CF384 TaxID=1884382 RepID=UPI00089859C9|nr:AAA family ATPase [Paenibacillus sp. CF384]SDX88365.1 AAA ATPase domain-containing protein [Paenibacillus sp. CF384]
MIHNMIVKGLNEKYDYNLTFFHDINILTGRNGAGKTTLLKLLWYLISGNIERAIDEIHFRYVYLSGDGFELEINNEIVEDSTHDLVQIKYTVGSDSKDALVLRSMKRIVTKAELEQIKEYEDIDVINRVIEKATDSSLFFPTFRRIEGGFSITGKGKRNRYSRINVEEALNTVSNELSVSRHKFISSVSTSDIVSLLTEKYANISEETNRLHTELTNYIEEQINENVGTNNNKSDKTLLDDANNILKRIHNQLNYVTEQRETLLKPFTVLSSLIADVFQHKGIKVTSVITLGEAKEAMFSDALSAGEKQMLSFLCYNAFSDNCPIFIDEPEISLHVDWQRILFPTLLSQSQTNQFFIATHSPFIYSKYEDREIMLVDDRGGF